MNAPILSTILMVFAFVLFAIAAICGALPAEPHRGRLVAAGLACWSLSIILAGWRL